MKISKTLFKQYTRCPHVCALDDLYKKRLQSDVSIFGSADEDDLIDLLSTMFDEDTGDDLIETVDPQMESLLPYFTKLEEIAMETAEALFKGKIIHSPITRKQKYFSFHENNHEYYCYVDGYLEKEDEIYIFEVKATTSKKFLELGPKINKEHYPIFIKEKQHFFSEEKKRHFAPSILRLNQHQSTHERFNKQYQKLFNRYEKTGRYVFDIAVERIIIEKALKEQGIHPKKVHYYLVVLNSDYLFDGTYQNNEAVYHTSIDLEEIVTFIDASLITSQYQEKIYDLKKQLEEDLIILNPLVEEIGKFCEAKKPSKCPFIPTCWDKVLIKGSILEYMDKHHGFEGIEIVDGVQYPKKYDYFTLIKQGFYTLNAIPKTWLTRKNNLIQRECFESNNDYINQVKITSAYNTLKWPLYYLDFESFPCPLPRYKNEKPYMQSVFQYSLHIENKKGKCDFDKNHKEYLAPDFSDHRRELVEKLIEDIDLTKGGTVIVYNKNFEHTRIEEFSELYPEYKEALYKINAHMFDLLDLVKTNISLYQELGFSEGESKEVNYYHNDLAGSYSIKKVLPVFSSLSYSDLKVGNGGEAIAAYSKFPFLEKDDLEQLRDDLLKYCKQDTWAMVVVLWELIKRLEKEHHY